LRSQRIQGESRRLSFNEIVFELTAAVLVGRALYLLLFNSVDSVIVPFLRGLFSGQENELGYISSGSTPLHTEFNGYFLFYELILDVLGTLLLAAVVVVLLVAYARREAQQAPIEVDAEIRACPECLSPIPAAARRCARCRAPVQPQAPPEDTST